jgi:photosystem II stability/assembly factor-like uncharacterized protein
LANKTTAIVGTKKGVFLLESDAARKNWRQRGPFCEHWPIHHAIAEPATATIYAAGGNEWFGPAIWSSRDLGETWTHSSQGLAYPEGQTPVKTAWSVTAAHGRVYAGVEPAGLFVSDDHGQSWRHIEGLQKHPSRSEWQPGGAGLILHSIVANPENPLEMWIGISSVGVFHTADGGETWATRNKGTRCDYMPEGLRYPEFGQCVHGIALAPGTPNRLYQQNHCGMYRSDDGGANWESIEAGLPSSFGFPVAAHPRDPDRLFFLPLNGDTQGRYPPGASAAVWRSDDAGHHWSDKRAGLPQDGAYFGVMRQAMATDAHDPAGVYFGSSNGSVYASRDEGETWACIARDLPGISSVETLVTEA